LATVITTADMATIADLLGLENRTDLGDGIISGTTKLDPDKANLLLEINTRNRKISQEAVTAYARMMAAGKWLFNGAPYAVGTDCSLQDGQHRCLAIVESGATVDAVALLGLPPEAQIVTDTGRRRSASDTLTLAGVPNSANAAATVRILMAWDGGKIMHGGFTAGNVEVLDYLRDKLDVINAAVTEAMRARNNGVPIPTSALAAVHVKLVGMPEVPEEMIKTFFSKVCDGTHLSDGDPELALRGLLMRRHANGVRVSRAEGLYYIIAAWNARATGQQRDRIQLPRLGLKAETSFRLLAPTTAVGASNGAAPS
jgi:hypothetical protein